MIWTLVLFLFTMWVLSKVAFPKIQEALDKRAKRSPSRSRRPNGSARVRRAARGVPRPPAEAREQADDIMARAARRRITPRRGNAASQEKREELVARRSATSSRDAALARADPQGGRRPDRAGDEKGHPQVATAERPAVWSRRRCEVDFSRLSGEERRWRDEEVGPRIRRALFDAAKEKGKLDGLREQLPSSPTPLEDRELQVFLFSPYFSSPRSGGGPGGRGRERAAPTSSSC
jgi:F-type H+-transporting ATPase subunit b